VNDEPTREALVAEVRRLTAELKQAQQQLDAVDDEIEEFEAAAQDDPNTPAGVLLMIQILRRIRPAAVSGA
jgi:cysteinyl-tRNA synthetase